MTLDQVEAEHFDRLPDGSTVFKWSGEGDLVNLARFLFFEARYFQKQNKALKTALVELVLADADRAG